MNPYLNCKILGPYYNKRSKRKYVVIKYPDGKREGTTYSRYLIEVHLGRILLRNETVDHIDRDKTNDALDNLQVIKLDEHSKLDAKYVTTQEFECPVCRKKFHIGFEQLSRVKADRNRGRSGPYCGRRCAGIDSHNENRKISEVKINYFYLKK